jgi:hypothetical protein
LSGAVVTRASNLLENGVYRGSDEAIGELSAAPDGFWLAFASRDGRASADIGAAHLSLTSGGVAVDKKVWLTDTASINETEPHLVPFQGGFLAAYTSAENGSRSHLVELDAQGRVLRRAADITGASAGGSRDWPLLTYFTYPNRDAGWVSKVYNASARTYELGLVRVSGCTPPSVTITAPQSSQPVVGTVTLSAAASDDVAVSRVEFLLDGALLGSDGSAPYTFTLSAEAYAAGEHTLTVPGTAALRRASCSLCPRRRSGRWMSTVTAW